MSTGELSRRSVLNGCGVAAAGGVAGFVVARSSDAAKPKRATEAANAYGETPTGGGQLLVKVNDVPAAGGLVLADAGIVLIKDSAGNVHGFSATCTHQGCLVTSVENGLINCPCHGSRFDIATGNPVAGPAGAPLPPVAVVVQGDGVFTG